MHPLFVRLHRSEKENGLCNPARLVASFPDFGSYSTTTNHCLPHRIRRIDENDEIINEAAFMAWKGWSKSKQARSKLPTPRAPKLIAA